ncbi:MAG: hypothetical protein HKN85_12140, partial [Gammaproteobacteria bacterium]|nr:hypothetical protein [Gammaproteobacteria bacterium]
MNIHIRIRSIGAALLLLLSICTTNATAADAGAWDLGGRLELDWASFDSDQPELADNFIVRRARVEASRYFSDELRFKIMYDLRDSKTEPKSLWLRYEGQSPFRLTVGSFKQPHGLQSATSSRFNVFMERSLTNAFSQGYRVGGVANFWGDGWAGSMGITGGSLNENHRIVSDGKAVFGRLSVAPINGNRDLLHFGLTAENRRYDRNDRLRLRSRPENQVTDVRFVDTRFLSGIDESHKYVAELAAGKGAFAMQAEVSSTVLQRPALETLQFAGHYVQASMFLTGESRSYNRKMGAFTSLKPTRKSGAWEIAIRYSKLDLNNREIAGGIQENLALALNWYHTKYTRLSLNVIDARARPDRNGDAADARIVQLR